MRLHFGEKPWDLYASVGYVVVMSAALLVLNTGNLLAILLVLFFPGYVLVGVLFPGLLEPDKPNIDWVERIALAFGLSIAVVPLLGLLLNFTPWGIRFAPFVAAIALFTAGVGYVAFRRRMQLPPERRLSATLNVSISAWKESSLPDKTLSAALAACVVAATGTFAYVLLTSRTNESFTEFYLLGPSGNASGYPTSLKISQPGSVILGIGNHESASVNYTVRIDLVGVTIAHNVTSGHNETVEVNRTTWSAINVTLVDGRNWTRPYTFQINYTGLWKVQFLLFKDGDFSSAYRELHLYVRVT